VNGLLDIALLQSAGAPNSPQAPASSPGPQDLLGFLNQLLQLTQTQESGAAAPVDAKDLEAKLAALLKKDGAAPEGQDLASEIAALLQQNGAGLAADAVKPALISDLVARLSQQIQAEPPAAGEKNADLKGLFQKIGDFLEKNQTLPAPATDGGPLEAQTELPVPDATPLQPQAAPPATEKETMPAPALAGLLNNIQPGSGKDDGLEKIITQIQDQPERPAAAAPPPDPLILQQLKDKAAQIPQTDGAVSTAALAQFKADVIQTLKDQGVDDPGIGRYLAALIQFLKEADPAAGAETEQQPDLAAALPQIPVTQPPAEAAPAVSDIISRHAAPKMPQIQIPAAAAPDSTLAEAPKPDTMPRTTAPLPAQKDAAAPTQQPNAAAALPAQNPAPPQPLSAKIAGIHINPNIISALANSDSGFSLDDFGSENKGQMQDMTGNAALLKPATADAMNTQNFTNYLTAARNAPSAMTQMVNIQMQRNISAKISTMTLQLHPADLGEMDIKLKFEEDGNIRAHLSVEKPETLALLQKDSYYLERVLQQNGVKIDADSLSFDLRQQKQQQNMAGFNGQNKNGADDFSAQPNGNSADQALQAKISVPAYGYITQSGVNIMV
jgi:flagellar hook-length control protein FliK